MGYIRLILFLALIGGIGGAYAYHQIKVSNLEKTIAELRQVNQRLEDNAATLEEVAAKNEQAVKELRERAEAQNVQIAGLQSRNAELQRDKDTYLKIFKDHNLTRLARAKPGLIEKRVNTATAKVFRQVEDDSKYIMSLGTNDSGRLSDVGNETSGSSTEDSQGSGTGATEDLPTPSTSGN